MQCTLERNLATLNSNLVPTVLASVAAYLYNSNHDKVRTTTQYSAGTCGKGELPLKQSARAFCVPKMDACVLPGSREGSRRLWKLLSSRACATAHRSMPWNSVLTPGGPYPCAPQRAFTSVCYTMPPLLHVALTQGERKKEKKSNAWPNCPQLGWALAHPVCWHFNEVFVPFRSRTRH
jgi:hypothetical protein